MVTTRSKSSAPNLKVDNFGPITHADVTFGDLTVFVGPQATGKSLLLQLAKLIVDTQFIKQCLTVSGVDWEGEFPGFLDVYFGEGMRSVWSESTHFEYNDESVNVIERVNENITPAIESMFFIPAQRVLAIRDGWPLAFNYYDASHPFTLRQFSEQLRLFTSALGSKDILMGIYGNFRSLLEEHLFPGFELKIDTQRAQRRLVLAKGKNASLPVSVWSAGQREFVPLLLGMYVLMLLAKTEERKPFQWVVIEEPEMGLHPRAITVVILMIFELMNLGYRVCLSTHSPQVLEAIWALHRLKKHGASAASLLNVFNVEESTSMIELAEMVMKKEAKVYYFDRKGMTTDISELDPGAGESEEADWGGLTEFSGRANEAVASAVANSHK